MIYKELLKREEQNKCIKTAIVGAGFMGNALVNQMMFTQGMVPSMVSSRNIESAIGAYLKAGLLREDIKVARSLSEAEKFLHEGRYVVCDDNSFARAEGIDCVVEATGSPENGAKVAYECIKSGKHVVMLNVEADVACGVKLKKMADRMGVVYTGSAGDEPGAVMELYDFARASGFKVMALGKGKNNPIDYSVTPDSCREQAAKSGLNPWMLSSFIDGTKTMIELNAIANATGFLPDVRSCHGIESGIAELADKFRLKSEGGILNRYGAVDYVRGVAPGVFAIISTDSPVVDDIMRFLKVGSGPNYALYRPYHLTSLETPISIAKAVIYNEATIAPAFDENVAETVAVAKKDIQEGEYFDAIGGCTFLGTLMTNVDAESENGVPVGFMDEGTRAKRSIKAGEIIRFDDVEFTKQSFIRDLMM